MDSETRDKLNKYLIKYRDRELNASTIKSEALKYLRNRNVSIDDISLKKKSGRIDYHFDDSVFLEKHKSTHIVPLSNDYIKKLLKCKKVPIQSAVYTNGGDRSVNNLTKNMDISGTYLVGVINGKPYEFALSICKKKRDNQDLCNFSISLSVLVSKEHNIWCELTRFDSMGFDHPNYVDENGKLVKSVDDIKMIPTPHIHLTSEESTILTEDSQRAFEPSEEIKLGIHNGDRKTFGKVCKSMFEACNIITGKTLNEYVVEDMDYDFHEGQNIFDEGALIVPESVDEIGVIRELI